MPEVVPLGMGSGIAGTTLLGIGRLPPTAEATTGTAADGSGKAPVGRVGRPGMTAGLADARRAVPKRERRLEACILVVDDR